MTEENTTPMMMTEGIEMLDQLPPYVENEEVHERFIYDIDNEMKVLKAIKAINKDKTIDKMTVTTEDLIVKVCSYHWTGFAIKINLLNYDTNAIDKKHPNIKDKIKHSIREKMSLSPKYKMKEMLEVVETMINEHSVYKQTISR